MVLHSFIYDLVIIIIVIVVVHERIGKSHRKTIISTHTTCRYDWLDWISGGRRALIGSQSQGGNVAVGRRCREKWRCDEGLSAKEQSRRRAEEGNRRTHGRDGRDEEKAAATSSAPPPYRRGAAPKKGKGELCLSV